MDDITHLDGIRSQYKQTDRLEMHVLTAGEVENTPVLFLHGNTSSATIWEQLMADLSDDCFCIAPDLRGFGRTEEEIIDATGGINDWLEDLESLITAMSIDKFHLVAHSLGGFIGWGVIARHSTIIKSATLIAPGPPMGFGGTHGKQGVPNNDDYSGSGAGIVVQELVDRIKKQDRSTEDPMYSPRNVINRLFWKQGFKADREEAILSAMLAIHTGDQQYPGDWTESDHWPGVAPGNYGPVNAMSPKYNTFIMEEFLEAQDKPPLLWIQGEDDNIIADKSFSDPGYQGKLELLDGWPGQKKFPPQPMQSQVAYALNQYKKRGGDIDEELIADSGHTPFIEKPEQTTQSIRSHMS